MALVIKILEIIKIVIRTVYPNLKDEAGYNIMEQIFNELWVLIKYFLKKYYVRSFLIL
jgi:hypothetical protein